MSILDRPEPLNCNGNPVHVGVKVRHSLAKHVKEWGDNGLLKFLHADLPPLMSVPFPDEKTVVRVCNPMCVELAPHSRRDGPIYMADFLEPAQ